MTPLLLALGTLLILASLVEAVTTTVAVSAGGGPLTRVFAHTFWRVVQRTSSGPRPSWLHRRSGALVLLTTLAFWIVLHYAGWFLIFSSSDVAVLDAQTSAPASTVERLYYVGFILFTLGVGDFVAGGAPWQLLTVVATFTGLFLVTLSITYVLSVVSAAVTQQAFASSVHGLGGSAEEIVLQGWTGTDFSSAFVRHLVQLSSQVATLAEQHLAYPVLHFFVADERSTAAPRALALLDDAVLLLEHGVAPHARPPASATRPVTASITRYLESAVSPAPDLDPAPTPDLSALAAHGVPVSDVAAYDAAVHERADRRRRIAQLVASQGWTLRTG